mmetsp:Transcript_28118/g.45589  ORF Transcript_28118/g.45589 Transcript_28118/m.45589 type:complete len:333 (+) Transcript_28118:592-1590(+)
MGPAVGNRTVSCSTVPCRVGPAVGNRPISYSTGPAVGSLAGGGAGASYNFGPAVGNLPFGLAVGICRLAVWSLPLSVVVAILPPGPAVGMRNPESTISPRPLEVPVRVAVPTRTCVKEDVRLLIVDGRGYSPTLSESYSGLIVTIALWKSFFKGEMTSASPSSASSIVGSFLKASLNASSKGKSSSLRAMVDVLYGLSMSWSSSLKNFPPLRLSELDGVDAVSDWSYGCTTEPLMLIGMTSSLETTVITGLFLTFSSAAISNRRYRFAIHQLKKINKMRPRDPKIAGAKGFGQRSDTDDPSARTAVHDDSTIQMKNDPSRIVVNVRSEMWCI